MSTTEAFNRLLAVKAKDYSDCVDVLEHDFTLNEVAGNLRFHHLKSDGNGRPMVKRLAETLYNYIIDYCIASKNREEPLTPQQAAKLTKEARKLFRHPNISGGENDRTGEAGEALLFFLTEAILQAPQVVAKMELKTNSNDEIKGSDGIHARWNADDNLVDFYFGESKLYQNVNSAIRSALKSMSDFHDNEMYKHEFSIVTKHFKYANDEMRKHIIDLIRGGEPGGGARINHACLIGYDSDVYYRLKPAQLQAQVKAHLLKDGKEIVKTLNQSFSAFERKYLRFDIFFLPFPSVAEFRNEFNSALD
jgi:hypothetical protein